jgi:hypothetical protein
MNSPLKFFKAKVVSANLYIGNSEYLRRDHPVSVAKWKDGFYVIALNSKLYTILSEEHASFTVKTIRLDGKLIPSKGITITGTEDAFKFKVQAGHTCPDGCCGEDSPRLTETLSSPEEATKRFNALVSDDYNRPMDFVRAYGPGLALRNWNRPND